MDASWSYCDLDLVFKIIMFGAFFLYGCVVASGDGSVMYQFCDLDLISRIIVSGAYLVYYLREESQICCIDTSLDADVWQTIFVILTYNPSF